MPRNSSGLYSLPTGNPVVIGTLIEAGWANPTLSDVGSALSESLDRYGRGGMLAAFKLTDGTQAAPGLAFNSEASTGFFRAAAGELSMSVQGSLVGVLTKSAVMFTVPLGLGGGLSLAAGTAAAPSLVIGNAPNSGFYSPAGGVGIVTGGVERLQVNGFGNVGIGGGPLTSKLTVYGSTQVYSAPGPSDLRYQGDIYGTLSWAAGFNASGGVNAYGASNQSLYFGIAQAYPMRFLTTATERLTIDTTGNVGVNQPAPSYRLDVAHSTGSTATLDVARLFAIAPGNSAARLLFGSTSLPVSGAIACASENASGGNLSLQTAQLNTGVLATRMILDSSGNVGIGTAAPASQLQVSGPGQSGSWIVEGSPKGGTLYLQASGGGSGIGGAVTFGTTYGNQTAFAGIKGMVSDGSTWTAGDLCFSTRGNAALAGMSERMRITGIGQTKFFSPATTANDVASSYSMIVGDKLCFVDASRALNNRQFEVGFSAGTFRIRAMSDSYAADMPAMTITGGQGAGLSVDLYSGGAIPTLNMWAGMTGAGGPATTARFTAHTAGSAEAVRIVGNDSYLSFYATGNITRQGYLLGGPQALQLVAEGSGALVLGSGNAERMRIDALGQVVIGGTASPQSGNGRGLLTINGTGQSMLSLTIGGAVQASLGAYAGFTELRSASGMLSLCPGTNEVLRLMPDGRVMGTGLHNNPNSVAGPLQYIASGTYTPTIANLSNTTNLGAYRARWMRVGNVMFVCGQFIAAFSASNSPAKLSLSLPFAASLYVDSDLDGVASSDISGVDSHTRIIAGVTNKDANVTWAQTSSTGPRRFSYFFSFEVT